MPNTNPQLLGGSLRGRGESESIPRLQTRSVWVQNNNQHFGERRKEKPKDLGIKLANDSRFFAEEAEVLVKKNIPFISFIKSA